MLPKLPDPKTCEPISGPITLAPTTAGERALGAPQATAPTTEGPAEYNFWSPNGFEVKIRRFGDHFVHVADIPPGRDVILTLPVLSSTTPYRVSVDGACLRS